MPAFTERDRATRAKLKARYGATIKQKATNGDVGRFSPIPPSSKPNPVQVIDNRDDEQLSSARMPESDAAIRDTSPPTQSNDTTMDVPMRSQEPSLSAAQQRATQVAMAKKKIAASRKAVSPVKPAKTAYNYKPIVETKKVARPRQPVEKQVNEAYTPPRVVSKREMARKLAASRVTTSSPQPKMQKPEPVVKNSISEKRNAFAYKKSQTYSYSYSDVGSMKSASSSFEKPEVMDRCARNKTEGGTRSNELARLRAASPAVVAAARVKTISQPQLPVEHYESDEDESTLYDEDESTLCDEYLARDAVLQRREQFRMKQVENNAPKAIRDSSFVHSNKHTSDIVSDPHVHSMRDQYLKKLEDKRRAQKAVDDASFLQPNHHMHDHFDSSFPDPDITSISRSSSDLKKLEDKRRPQKAVNNASFHQPNNHMPDQYGSSFPDPPLPSISHSSSAASNPSAKIQHSFPDPPLPSVSHSSSGASNPSAKIQHSFPDPVGPLPSVSHSSSAASNPSAKIHHSFPDPPLPSVSHSSSASSNPSAKIQQINEVIPPPPPPPPPHKKTETENVSQDFGDGFGFSQEEFSHASWGVGPAFSADTITNGDAEWSHPVNCSAEQKGSNSAEWASSFDAKTSKDEEEDAAKDEDKENIETTADDPQCDEVSPSATASVQYVDFPVGRSRGGSVDCDSIIDEEEELGNSIVSEETTASATEFDPLSMFGDSDDELSQALEQSDDNAQSRVSWANPTIPKEEEIADNLSNNQDQNASSFSQQSTKVEDASNSISFPSLNSASLTKPPNPAPNNFAKVTPHPAKNVIKAPPDSPSGTESLESWWQSRYASSQNNDINAAVQEALLNEASSASKKSQADSSKTMSGVSTLSSNLTPVTSNERAPSCEINEEDSCSIFSGISGIDEVGQKASSYQAAVTKNLLGPIAQNIDLAESEEEDIFSGVSATNTKDLQADDVAMKSDMGGTSSGFTLKRANAESHSMLYGNNTVATPSYAPKKAMNSLVDGMSTVSFSSPIQPTNAPSQYMRESKEPLRSLPENNYGVIELKNNEKSSPANSHTSDITSSVIFGCDPPRRVAHQRYEREHERILETNESEEAESMLSKEVSVTDKLDQVVEGEVNKTTIANRGVSLVAPSSCDSTSQGSTFDQTKTTGMQTEAESQAAPFGLSGLRDQAKAAILSRFSCGLLNASSFAVCAPNGGQTQAELSPDDIISSHSKKESDYNKSDVSKSGSPDDEIHDDNSRHPIEMSPEKDTPPPPPFSPHSIRLRESSFGKGGVEVTEAAANATLSIEAQNELPVHKSASEAQKEAHEALLLYAYTALSVPPPKTLVEKGQGAETNSTIYPSIDGGVREMGIMMERFRSEGIAVLKLNTHNQWQPRVLTVTKEVNVFQRTDDARYKGIDSCPKGLLWLKKFSDSEHSIASIIGKKGKGGIFFSTIESVSVTKGIHPLSKKQQKGAFKDSYTFVLFLNDQGAKREIYFRVASKDDVILLSAGFQAVIDRVKNDEHLKPRSSFKLTVDTMVPGRSVPLSPLLSPNQPLSSRKAVANPISDNRWEV